MPGAFKSWGMGRKNAEGNIGKPGENGKPAVGEARGTAVGGAAGPAAGDMRALRAYNHSFASSTVLGAAMSRISLSSTTIVGVA
jgi:hypothetical protein